MHFTNYRLCQIFGSKEPFGGRSVIVLGDFWQLPPVGDMYAFKARKNPLEALVGNPLWEKFLLYELTQIMRQKDDLNFAEALGRFSEGVLTYEDISMFEKRCFRDHDVLPENAKKAIHLFRSNKEVEEYNMRRVNELSVDGGIKIQFEAIDKVVGKSSQREKQQALYSLANLPIKDTYGLSKSITLQSGVRYMITTNIDVSDGLFNGATGIMQYIEQGVNRPQTVWIQFDDPTIGVSARSERKIISDKLKLPANLTPVQRVVKTFQVTKKGQVQICREQYPLTIAEGITIHKSQGQSMSIVVVQLKKGMSRSLLYVAVSRAISLEGLFLIGNFYAPLQPKESDEVVKEMNRLRNYSMICPKYAFLRSVHEEIIQIISHNVQSIRKHFDSIRCDKIYTNSHILLFQETWVLSNEAFEIKDFREIVRNPLSGRSIAFGTMIYAKNSPFFNVEKNTAIAVKSNDQHIEITCCSVNEIKIINIYKNPCTTFEFFTETMSDYYHLFEGDNVLLCGDFNTDFTSCSGNVESMLKKKFDLTLLSPRCSTTDKQTVIDAVFGKLNSYHIDVNIYESVFSYHKPLVIRLKAK